MIGTGTMSDPYLPIEENELLTRNAWKLSTNIASDFPYYQVGFDSVGY
jgi:DNA repair photolyase